MGVFQNILSSNFIAGLPWKEVCMGLRLIALPTACICLQWVLLHDKERVLSIVPALFSASHYDVQSRENVPLHPKNLLESFQLGSLWERYQGMDSNTPQEERESVLTNVSRFVKGRPVSAEEMNKLPQLIEAMTRRESIMDRIRGAFNVTNVLWCVSIAGISMTALPAGYVVFSRFINFGKLHEMLIRAALRLWRPTTYLLSFYVSVEAARYNEGMCTMNGIMTALTAQVLFGVVWSDATATLLHALRGFASRRTMESTFVSLSLLVFATHAAPAAILHQSSLLGYLVVVPCVMAAGLNVATGNLCYYLGFTSREEMMRVTIACGSTLAGFVGLRALGVDSMYLKPFEQPVAVFGSSVYLLSLHIMAYHSLVSTRVHHHHVAFYMYMANLLALLVAGNMYNLPQLSIVSQVYGGLFLFTMYGDYALRHSTRHDRAVWGLLTFSMMYGTASYLNVHPEIIQNFITASTTVAVL